MPRTYRLISGDSHLQIPPDRWTHHVPAKYRELAPRRIRLPNGGDGVIDHRPCARAERKTT